MSEIDLPSFEDPPVTETVLGVQFDQIPGLGATHLGAFWHAEREHWPEVRETRPLDQVFERFDSIAEPLTPRAVLRVLDRPPPPRVQLLNDKRDRMLQIQNGRVHYNWIKVGSEPYARYPAIREGFLDVWGRFAAFLEGARLGAPRVNQWEVTYVNQVRKGPLWSTCAEAFELVRTSVPALSEHPLEEFSLSWHFVIPPAHGRVHVDIANGRAGDGAEILGITLTARGPHEADAERSVGESLDLGRTAIVRAFAEMTSDKAHHIWRRTR